MGDARPSRVRALPNPPDEVWVAGQIEEDARAIAIVGSRAATAEALAFARELARELAKVDVAVVSGGAAGIDAAAHCGALDAGGRTWCVAPTGHCHRYPKEHSKLFEAIVERSGAMVWPFPPEREARRHTFYARNGVLVALSDAVVIVQAGLTSGTMNTARWCSTLRVPLYIVGAAPWSVGFDGSRHLLELGAAPVFSVRGLLVDLGLVPRGERDPRPHRCYPTRRATPALTATEKAVFEAVGTEPIHVDEIVARSTTPISAVTTALLTLALENILVEGPSGFFRRVVPIQQLNIPIDIGNSSQRHLDE
jgi:DNA processing protein